MISFTSVIISARVVSLFGLSSLEGVDGLPGVVGLLGLDGRSVVEGLPEAEGSSRNLKVYVPIPDGAEEFPGRPEDEWDVMMFPDVPKLRDGQVHYADEQKYSGGSVQNRNLNDDKNGILSDPLPGME